MKLVISRLLLCPEQPPTLGSEYHLSQQQQQRLRAHGCFMQSSKQNALNIIFHTKYITLAV